MRVFGLIGRSDSDKTAAAVSVIAELRRRGRTVGVLKNAPCEFRCDIDDCDTSKLHRTGASPVVARTVDGAHVLLDGPLSLADLLGLFNCDYVIVEGSPSEDLPLILAAADTADLITQLTPRVFAIAGAIAGSSRVGGACAGIPVIDAVQSAAKMANLIERAVPDRW